MISLDNGNSWHAPKNLDPAELERLWGPLTERMSIGPMARAHGDLRMIEGDKALFLELYFEHAVAGHRLAVG